MGAGIWFCKREEGFLEEGVGGGCVTLNAQYKLCT